MTQVEGEYERGRAAGGIEERLAGHDKHFAAINGSLEKFVEQQARYADEMHLMALALQRLADQAVARDATAATTAAALKDADEARRAQEERSWSPIAKLFAFLGALAAVAAIVGLYLSQQ